MGNPLVSIIIPTYARPDNLCRAINSVLTQTYSPIEIIVVDDNGTNTPNQLETEKILKYYIEQRKIQYIKHETNKNGSAARNTGSRASHGEIIGYLDDDDEFLPSKIEEQVKRLEAAHAQNPKVAGVYCNILMKGYSKGDFALTSTKEGNLAEALLLSEIRFNSSTIMLYKFAFEKIGGWDERFKRHQDWEFCVRFFDFFEMVLASPETPLIQKHSTPNFNTSNPDKIAYNMQFFLHEMKPYIMKMDRRNEIFSKRYFNLANLFFRIRKWREGFQYLRRANNNRKMTINDLFSVIKSITKGYVK